MDYERKKIVERVEADIRQIEEELKTASGKWKITFLKAKREQKREFIRQIGG